MTSNNAPIVALEEVIPDSKPPQSQGRLIFKRFLSNKVAVGALILIFLIVLFSISAIGLGPIHGWWKYGYTGLNNQENAGAPTMSLVPEWLGGKGITIGNHPFGQNRIGKDYFAMTMRGIQNSSLVMVVLGLIATIIGVIVGAIAGYYRGKTDAILMRITDVFIVIPALVIGAVVGNAFGGFGALTLAIMLGFFSWMGIARLVRGEFLSLREREFV